MKEMWDARYSKAEYAYGKEPNVFFREILNNFEQTGKLLLPAEGEGRNAVHAAKKGWDVYAFDISEAGKQKAEQLAQKEQVSIAYEVGDFPNLNLTNEQFDAAAMIYAHFPPNIRLQYHQLIADLIKPGGIIILEGFSKNHLELRRANIKAGGPNNLEMLYSTDEIRKEFPGFEVLRLEETETNLAEGKFHNGTSRIIRFIGRKK